jgi:hypothetical protein
MKRFLQLVAFVAYCVLLPPSQADQRDITQKLVGEWRGRRHIRAYYADGSFTLDPQPGGKPLGTWKLKGRQLITQFTEGSAPMSERIVKITDTEMIDIYDGTRYTYKRVVHK